jgi:hypothetical protein
VVAWIHGLALVSPELSVWYIPRGSPSTANQNPFQAAPDRILAEAKARPALPRNEDAFIFNLWNGKDDAFAAGLGVRDRVKLPGDVEAVGSADLEFPRNATLKQVISAITATVEAFEPEIAGVASTANWSLLDQGRAAGPVMYFSDERFQVGPLPVDIQEVPTRAPGRILRLDGWAPQSLHQAESPDVSSIDAIVRERPRSSRPA